MSTTLPDGFSGCLYGNQGSLKTGGVLESMLPKKIKRYQGKELYD